MGVFDLPGHMMLGVASLLLSAAAIDRQDEKVSNHAPQEWSHTLRVVELKAKSMICRPLNLAVGRLY